MITPETLKFVTLLGATGDARVVTHEGRDWTVVPVVAMVEGVIRAVNAPAPELVRAGLFPKALGEWEGKPVFAGHPMRDGVPVDGLLPEILPKSFGMVRNAAADARALRMEAWLDHARCAEGTDGGRILARVRAVPPHPLEVSVGAWVGTSRGEGVWSNGKRYAAEWTGWAPNHLALLEEMKGACSIEMGCGTHRYAMRVAADGQSAELEENVEHKNLFQRVLSLFRSAMPRGWGDDEVKQELRDALLLAEPAFANGEILRVKNDAVVYCLYPPPMYYDTGGAPPKMTYWQRGYTFDTATQKFTMSAERTQVEPTTHYEPYRAAEESQELLEPTIKAACACGNTAADAAGETTMQKQERIAALVANPHNKGRSLKMLEAASDDDLTIIETEVGGLKATADKAVKDAADAAAEATRIAAAVPATAVAELAAAAPVAAPVVPETEEQVLARFPAIKSVVDSHRAAEAAQKTELIKGIRAASQAFTQEQLEAESLDKLKRLAMLAKVEAPKDYSLQGTPRLASHASDLASFAAPDPYADSKTATH